MLSFLTLDIAWLSFIIQNSWEAFNQGITELYYIELSERCGLDFKKIIFLINLQTLLFSTAVHLKKNAKMSTTSKSMYESVTNIMNHSYL